MSIKMRKGSAVPIVISEKVVRKAPETVRTTKYLGLRAGFSNLFNKVTGKVVELVHDTFFHEYTDVIDEGVVEEHHYIINIGGHRDEPELMVKKAVVKPPCAHHYEIISFEEEAQPTPAPVAAPEMENSIGELHKAEGRVFKGWTTDRPVPVRRQ